MEWMQLTFRVPRDDGRRLLGTARDVLGLGQIDEDWCTEKRDQDNATVDYAPCHEPPDRKAGW